MAKKKDATQDKGVSDEEKTLNPDTQKEELETKTEEELAEAKAQEEKDKKAQERSDALSDREKLVEEMADRLEEERAGDTDIEKETELTPEEETTKQKEADELLAKETEEKEIKTTDEKDTVEIIVDGVKKKVPVSQVTDAGIRALQKESAADVRLEEAVKLLKEAKETIGKKGVGQDSDKKTGEELKQLTKGIDKEKISQIREAIQFGDEDDAQTALEELIGLVTDARSTVPDNVMTVEKYKEIETEKTAQEILRKFNLPPAQGGFSDITDDRYLYAACREDVQIELEKGTPNTWELYETVGKNIRQWRDKKVNALDVKADKEAATQQAKDELAAKREKKAVAAGATIIGVNAKTETTNKEPKEQSTADIVNEMRIARGQPV